MHGPLILGALLLVGPVAQAQLGLVKKALDVVDGAQELAISEEEEIELGRSISERIRERYGVVQDVAETRYVSMVGLTVAHKTDRPNLPYEFIILDSSAVNAFAVPGGIVHITRGALGVIESEAELACVLGHEIAHITLKHTIKAIKKDKSVDIASSASGLDDSFLLAQLTDKATEMVLAGYGREQEVNSDQIGIVYSSDAGYSPDGLLRFLATLKLRGSTGSGSLFRSHPETDSRTKKVLKVIEKEGLDETIWLAERYDAAIDYETGVSSDTGTGGPAVEGARGAAGADASEEPAAEPPKKSRFGLRKLKKTFAVGGDEQQTSEVTGIRGGAWRGRGRGCRGRRTEGLSRCASGDLRVAAACVSARRRVEVALGCLPFRDLPRSSRSGCWCFSAWACPRWRAATVSFALSSSRRWTLAFASSAIRASLRKTLCWSRSTIVA